MKKHLLFLFFLSIFFFSQAQVEIGLKFSPALSTNRVFNESDTLNFNDDGSEFRFIFGIVVDLPITDNYYFSTGLSHVPKRVAVQESVFGVTEEYKLQYLQIPASLKLFTNEIAIDTKLFFQVGMTIEIKINDEKENKNNVIIEKFSAFDTSVILAGGVERNLGTNTILMLSFSYNRGLINSVSENFAIDDDLQVKNDIFSIDLGIKF